ncbi:MAG: hypothetical protein KDD58_05395 [Bdellovibrionales bacterium]|nr:hypothetical protein [Bdellovibrionales bacterium]
MKKYFLVFLVFIAYPFSFAQQMDSASQEALKQTQELLQNQQQRDAYIRQNKDAGQADQNVKNLTGGDAANTQEMYSIAADVMNIVAEKAKKPNGEVDVEKMNQLMMQYQSNPEAFYREMTPEQRARIKALGKKIGPAPASQN